MYLLPLRFIVIGAAAITIYPDFFDNNEALLKEYIDYCRELNLEPILMIKNEMEAKMGFKCKVRYVIHIYLLALTHLFK